MQSPMSVPPSPTRLILSPTCSIAHTASTLPTPIYMEHADASMAAPASPTPPPKIPTAPAAMITASKKWISPAEQARQQRLREEKAARFARNKLQHLPRNEALDRYEALQLQWHNLFPGNSHEFLPRTFSEWIEHQKLMKRMLEQHVERQKQSSDNMKKALSLAKEQGSSRGELMRLGGKDWKLGKLRGAVLAQQTIWTRLPQAQAKHASQWPSPKEFKYEGEDRHATKDSDFHHFLPLPRDWRQELRLLHPHNMHQNYKYWEEFPRHHLFHFDYLRTDFPPSHFDIYPFSIGCPTPDCDYCWDYRKSYGLLVTAAFIKAVAEYRNDTSSENLAQYLSSDLLEALDSDDL